MKRFPAVILALAFSAAAMAVMFFVVRPNVPFLRARTEGLRHKLGEVIEEITELEEGDA